MATTFQTNDKENLQETLADTFLSKLDIDSKFLNEVIDKVFNLASKNSRIGPIKQKQTENTTPTKQTKEKLNKEEIKIPNAVTTKQPIKNEPLNVTNNTFEITNTSKPQTTNTSEVEILKSNNIFERFFNTIEKTTNKLEETVKKVPRPWELTPGTSIGYQMLTGDDEAMNERIRKGLAQFIGRYATNIKEPLRYEFPDLSDPKFLIKNILKDSKFDSKITTGANFNARETLYRELFDLPTRANKDILDQTLLKTGNKQYTIVDPSLTPKPLKGYRENAGPGYYGKPASHATVNPILGGTYLNALPNEAGYTYKDVWDLITSGENSKTTGTWDGDAKSYWARTLTAPLLRPATVSGTIDKEGTPISKDINFSKEPTREETSITKDINFSKKPIREETSITKDLDFSKEVTNEISTKLEKIPVINLLNTGLESFKNNKWIEGLEKISSVAPSIKSVLTFLTAKEEPLKVTETKQLTDLSKPFNQLKDEMKDSTLTKIISWSNDLYNLSKEKVTNFTDSLENTFNETEKLNTTNLTETFKSFDTNSLKNFLKNIVPDTPSLQNTVDEGDSKVDNEALYKIVDNTENTNNTIKILSEAILRLAQSNGNNKSKNNNVILANTPQKTENNYPSASQVAANNVDPISIVRKDFLSK